MDNLEKILIALPKHKLGRLANIRIQFRLRRLMFLGYVKQYPSLNFNPSLFNKAFATAVVVLVIFGGTSIYAYANDDILPGDRIYPLKLAVEKIEKTIAPSSSAKIKVYEKHSTRRLEEAVGLSEKKINVEQENNKEKEAVSASIKKNIEAVIVNQQEIADSINNFDDYDKAVQTVTSVKKNDQSTTKYLDTIVNYAQTDKDEETVEKAKQAHESIDKQKYKFKNKEIIREEQIKSDENIIIDESLEQNSGLRSEDEDEENTDKAQGKNKKK